VDPQIMSLLL